MASEAQAQATPEEGSEGKPESLWALKELGEVLKAIDLSKCPPEIRNIGTLGMILGLTEALQAIRKGLSIASTHGCNADICQFMMGLIDKDLERIIPLIGTIEDYIKEGKMSTEVKELVYMEESVIMYDVAHFYPMLIDLLARYGKGRASV